MTTTRSDLLTTALTAAGAAVTPGLADAGRHEHEPPQPVELRSV